MKKIFVNTILCLIFASYVIYGAAGTNTKKIDKSFSLQKGESIIIECITGTNTNFVAWDKNEVKFDINLEVKSSDKKFTQTYLDQFDIEFIEGSGKTKFKFRETKRENGWSILDLLTFKSQYSIQINLTGNIYIPAENNLLVEMSYGASNFSDLNGVLQIKGKGNNFTIKNCKNLASLKNPYGDNEIIGCGGNLKLETRSSTILLDGFDGTLKIDAEYSDVMVSNVIGETVINDRSGALTINNIDGNLLVESDYSDNLISQIKGRVSLTSRSATINIRETFGVHVNAPYSEINVNNADDVRIKNQSGTINLSDIKSNVNVDDSYSDINLTNIKGDVTINSRSNTIHAENIMGNFNSQTEYSSYDLKELNSSNVNINNRSGSIEMEFNNPPKSIYTVNEYGSIEVTLPRSYEFNYELLTTYGSIRNDFNITPVEQGSSQHAYGIVGEAKEIKNNIHLKTTSENIYLKKK